MKFATQFPEREWSDRAVLRRGWAPVAIRRAIRQIGGLNPYDEALYRIVLADCVVELHGGRWVDWPEGLSIQEMGGTPMETSDEFKRHVLTVAGDKRLGMQEIVAEVRRLVPSQQQPLRVVEEMRMVKRYPYHSGWMLQAWRPPEQFGSRRWWEGQTVPGRPDLPILGPFPTTGDYEAIDHMELAENGMEISRTTYREMPDIGGLEHAIQFMEQQKYREREAATPEARIMIRLHDYQQQLDANRKKAEEDRSMYLTEYLKPYLGNSLGAGRLRTEAADEAGLKGHFGS